VEAILSAFTSKTYGGGGGSYRGRRGRQPFDESTFIPKETFNTITKDGKIKWASIPKEDRAKIVALFKNSPEPDSSRHPSPGQSSYVTPSRSTNNHDVRFDDTNDHNPFGVLWENDEDVDDNGGSTSLNMNSLRINKTLTLGSDQDDPQEPEDSPDVARALTIMNAVSSPVSSESLNKSVTNLLPGHIMPTLSTSLCVPSSSIPSSPCQILGCKVEIRGESDKTSKPRKWFNRRGKDGQEVKLSANMMPISGNGNGEKRDNNAGSADKGVGSTADRWGAAAQAELLDNVRYIRRIPG
jgi:hypothetical protein